MTPVPPGSVAAENASAGLAPVGEADATSPAGTVGAVTSYVTLLTAVGGPLLPALSTATTKYPYVASIVMAASVKLAVVGLPASTLGLPVCHTS